MQLALRPVVVSYGACAGDVVGFDGALLGRDRLAAQVIDGLDVARVALGDYERLARSEVGDHVHGLLALGGDRSGRR